MTEPRTAQRLLFTFRKDRSVRFLSHLDLMATFEYALRRAKLPLHLSEGFNPRPRFSLAAPLAVGHTGEQELLEIRLRASVDPQDALARLQGALPAGIELTGAVEMDPTDQGAASSVSGAVYQVSLPTSVPDLLQRIQSLLARESIEYEEDRDGAKRLRDIRPFIRGIEAPDECTLALHLSMGSAGSVRPELVLDLLKIPGDGAHIAREHIERSDTR